MRKLLTTILLLLISTLVVHNIHASNKEFNEKSYLNKIVENSEQESEAVRGVDPMVIGPDLYNQMGEISGYYGLSIAYIVPDFEAYTGSTADDFTVPAGESWDVKYLRTTYYTPFLYTDISFFNVYIYSDNNGKPGNLFASATEVTDVYYQESYDNTSVKDITLTLANKITLPANKYWISIQPATEVSEVNSYGDPDFWGGTLLQSGKTAIGSEGHLKNPGTGYIPFANWAPMSEYWETMQGVDYGFYNFNFALFGVEKSKDLAITEVISPMNGSGLSDASIVKVIVQNHGLTDIAADAYKMQYRIDGGAWTDEESGTAVTSGSEVTYTYRAEADFSAKGVYTIEARLVYAEDEYADNNAIEHIVENYGTLYPSIANEKVVYTTCEGTFTDHGGLGNVSVGYSRDTVVFMPATAGNRIRLEFYDTGMSGAYPFRFYNGSSVNAPKLGEWEALNSSEGIYTQEIHGLVLEGTNPEGAITVIIPGFDVNASTNNFLASVTCVPNVDVDFEVSKIEASKPYPWETETIQLIATLENQGLATGGQTVTFFADDVEIGSVSSTTIEFGELGTATIDWTPATAGTYEIKATIPNDEGAYVSEKELTVDKEIYPMGYFVEGFELQQYPPEGWENRVVGGTNRYFIWYNDRDAWEGKWQVSIGRDTLITPKLDISATDTLKFIYSAGFFGGTCDILYAPTLDGPWNVAHTVDYALPFAIQYEAPLAKAAGVNYIAFKVQGGSMDHVRGLNVYMANKDLIAADFDGPIDPQINTEVSYTFKVRNMGNDPLSGADYSVKLWKNIDGTVTEVEEIAGVDITKANYHEFVFTPTYTTLESGKVYATIEYAADEEMVNNTSAMLNLDVIKAGVEYVLDGDANSDLIDRSTIAGYWANYSESIYHKDSLNIKGEISGISIYYKNYYNTEVALQIYITETDQEHLVREFMSTQDMDMVYNDTLHVENADLEFKQIYIPFEKPFLYSGERNLALAFYRPTYVGSDEWGLQGMYLQASPRNETVQRSHGMQKYEKYTDVSDPEMLNALTGQTYNQVPNLMFYVKTTDMDASLVGTVSDESSNALQDVTISLEGFANTTKTDASGQYSFPVMPPTTLDVTASLYAYYDSTKTATLTSGNETVVDFNLEARVPVNVTGRVIANDSLKPVSGVEVWVTGYEQDIKVNSDTDGTFTVPGILPENEYSVKFGHFMYDTLVVTEYVSRNGSNLGDIVLDEIEQPGYNVFAKASGEDIEITWKAPYSGTNNQLKPMGDADHDKYLYNEPDEDAKLGNLYRVDNPGTVTSVDIHSYDWVGAQEGDLTVKIYNKERVLLAESKPFTMPLKYEWFTVDVPDFSYTDDFYVMVHWNKVHQQTPGISFHTVPDNDVAYFVDGTGKWQLVSDVLPAYTGAISIIPNVIEAGTKAKRAVVSYDIYRSDVANSQNEEAWTKITSTPVTAGGTDFSIIDESYSETGDGYYIYMLETHYTLADAPIVYSNDVNKGLYVEVTINVTPNNNDDITGAYVELAHTNGTSINTYIGSLADGKVMFPSVLKGNYKLKVTKGAGYEQYSETVVVDANKTFDVTLIENIFTPTNLNINVIEDEHIAEFTWALGDNKSYIVDDGSFEQALGISSTGNAALGNIFNYDAAGDIVRVDVQGIRDAGNNPNGEKGEVTLVFYDVASEELLGKSLPFKIEPDSMISVDITGIQFTGPFYALVKWSDTETLETDAIGVDTDENPGNGYYWDAELGFVPTANLGFYGNFGVRCFVLVNGKKTALLPTEIPTTNDKFESKVINNVELANAVSATESRSVNSFNVFLNDFDTPVATEITEQSYIFNNSQFIESGIQEAGVQAVYTSGTSAVAKTLFRFTVSVLDEINNTMVLYPNPAKNKITITNVDDATVEIYNTIGELVRIANINAVNNTIDVSTMTEGAYIVKIKLNEGSLYRNLIISE